jgi:integrase
MQKEVARRDAENTVGAMVGAFLESRNGDWRPRTAGEAKRHLELYARPLHGLPLTAVTLRDIASLLEKLTKESGATTGNRVRATLSSFFAWIIPQGNPVASTQKRKEAARDRVLTDAELKAIWHACGGDDYGAIVRLLMLTGQRAGEIGLLRWDEVFDEQIILPGERTKNHRAHVVPLSEPARAILSALDRKDRTFVFGGRDTGFKGWSKAKAKLDARLKLPQWTPHDLRRTAATGMAGIIGIMPHVVEAVLNHVSGSKAGVAGIYNRATYDKEKREALNVWAEHLLAVVEGRAPAIIPLKRA